MSRGHSISPSEWRSLGVHCRVEREASFFIGTLHPEPVFNFAMFGKGKHIWSAPFAVHASTFFRMGDSVLNLSRLALFVGLLVSTIGTAPAVDLVKGGKPVATIVTDAKLPPP